MFSFNKYRIVYMHNDFKVLKDLKSKLKNVHIPSVNELVLLNNEYLRVLNIIHSIDEKVIWVVVENLVSEENKGQNKEQEKEQ